MYNHQIIRYLIWIRESILCNALTEASQNLIQLISLLRNDNLPDTLLLREQLGTCLQLVQASETRKALAIMSKVLDRELTQYARQKSGKSVVPVLADDDHEKTPSVLSRWPLLLQSRQRRHKPDAVQPEENKVTSVTAAGIRKIG